MDSIHRNQPEQNRKDLHGSEAVEKIKEIVKLAENCFFCTSGSDGESSDARPMNVRQVDDQGNLWFLSANDSRKNQELERDPMVKLYFHGSSHSDFLAISGRASITTDRAKIKELWEPILSTWFTQSLDDPRITAIKVTPTDGYYWDTKHGNFVAGIKMMLGAALGKTLDDSIEGKVRV